MEIEIRSDTEARITGYVNATEKRSRPVITPHGRVVETIEPRAFAGAIERAGDVSVTVDHDKGHIYACTSDNTLTLTEDAIGLHADVLIRDPALIEIAREGKIRGWSFGMYNVRDELEPRAEELPLRRIKALDLDHVSLVVHQTPVYSATSVEVRAEDENAICTELRSTPAQVTLTDKRSKEETDAAFDNAQYHARIHALERKEGSV